jgi:quercetin dioxygenase-like cupin family protein
MNLLVQSIPRPDWTALPFEGCVNVEGKVLLTLDQLSIALLRFGPGATIHEHAATIAIDVVCLEGQGFTSVGGVIAPLEAGQRVHWPANVRHCLWTDSKPMQTMMVEHTRTT